jgi:hypothetical protein
MSQKNNILQGNTIAQFMHANPTFQWGDLPSSEGAAKELGVLRARLEQYHRQSSRRPSSGRTSSIQAALGRKGRKAHYTRKAILEREKEMERRKVWERRHPGASESNWKAREAKRKTRKQQERRVRD